MEEKNKRRQTEACPTLLGAKHLQKTFRASRMAMLRVYYPGGAEFQAARRHLATRELIWLDWAEELRSDVGRELTRVGIFPLSKYFRESAECAS